MLGSKALVAATLVLLAGCGGANGTRSPDNAQHTQTGGDAKPAAPDPAPADDAVASAKVLFFGHSLLGHSMPQMIGSFARAREKSYAMNGQVGWGTALLSHWRWEGSLDAGFVPPGFAMELPNSLLFKEDGKTALRSGSYDVLVMTDNAGTPGGTPGNWDTRCEPENLFGGCAIETVTNFVRLARQHNNAVRPFLYTNWQEFKDERATVDGWAADIDGHVGWWENVAERAEAQLASEGVSGPPIRIIPVGPVLARIVREARDGKLAALGIADHAAFFSDNIHLTDLGFYVVALAHYTAIYRDTPVGLPGVVDIVTDENKAERVTNGFTVDAKLASHLQQVVWEVLEGYPRSGVRN